MLTLSRFCMHVQDQGDQLHQALHQQVRSAPHLRHISPHRSFFIGLWDTCQPSSEPCAGACSAAPRAFAFLRPTSGHPGWKPAAGCPQTECDASTKNGAGPDTHAPAPPAHPSVCTPEGGNVAQMLTQPLPHGRGNGSNGAHGAAQHAHVRLPEHSVVEVTLQRLQAPPRQLLRSGWRPRLAQVVRVARAAAEGANLAACDLLGGIWCACHSRFSPHSHTAARHDCTYPVPP